MSNIKVYNQNNEEIPADAFEIMFKGDRVVDDIDSEYQSKFPKSNEQFYIKLYVDKLPEGTTKISKIGYEYK